MTGDHYHRASVNRIGRCRIARRADEPVERANCRNTTTMPSLAVKRKGTARVANGSEQDY